LHSELKPETSAADVIECGIRPGPVARACQQYAASALTPYKEAGFEHTWANHHRLCPPQHRLRILGDLLRHDFRHSQRRSIDQGLLTARAILTSGQRQCGETDGDETR